MIIHFEEKFDWIKSERHAYASSDYTQCTVKLRPNFQKIAQLKCTTNEKRNLSEHDEKNFKWKIFLRYIEFFSRFDIFVYLSG